MSSALAAVRTEEGGREPPRHFLELMDFEPATLRRMLDLAAQCKRGALAAKPLAGRTVALIFEKPSTRTRVSFEVGVKQLGGDVVMLYAWDMQSSRGEAVSDTAKVLSRFVDAIMMRTVACSAISRMRRTSWVRIMIAST